MTAEKFAQNLFNNAQEPGFLALSDAARLIQEFSQYDEEEAAAFANISAQDVVDAYNDLERQRIENE